MHRCTFELNNKPISSFNIGAAAFPAFSGLGDFANRRSHACAAGKGPIPPGNYYIFDRQSGGLLSSLRNLLSDHSAWFALHAIDDKIDDETLCDRIKRGAFRLHPKGTFGISQGCIVIEKAGDFQLLRSMLKSTPPMAVPGSSLKAYGTVLVR